MNHHTWPEKDFKTILSMINNSRKIDECFTREMEPLKIKTSRI
jgi:hypothetical protein